MSLFLVLIAILCIFGGGCLALLTPRSSRSSTGLSTGGLLIGSLLGGITASHVLLRGTQTFLHLPWQVPYGSFSVALDPLTAFFLLLIFGLAGLVALYGTEYMGAWRKTQRWRASLFFFNALVASMGMVVLARNGILFLVSWETMSLASFFLVTFEDEKESVRQAGWTYLVATHLGTAFLLALFILLGQGSGSLDFDAFTGAGTFPPHLASILFCLVVVGFGTKAGLMPFHVWLPEAHPVAPSHVSALMSGVMIKMGIYGILRSLLLLGLPPPWWGWLLIGLGALSGVLGILLALAQQDLKKMLAYSSVENIGIIVLGIGLGTLGQTYHRPALTILGWGGALLHMLNHTLYKGLLFLSAGTLLHQTGLRKMDQLGGLIKKMPWTGAGFLVAAATISGLPPLNGFLSEFLIYLAALKGVIGPRTPAVVPMLAVIAALTVIGGLALACFAKAFGSIFLGHPRNEQASRAQDPGALMRFPMIALAGGCLGISLSAPLILLPLLKPLLISLSNFPATEVESLLRDGLEPITYIVLVSCALFSLGLAIAIGRWLLIAKRPTGQTVTWDCGYADPSARMQYTATSFSQPLVGLCSPILRSEREILRPQGLFPTEALIRQHTPDLFHKRLYQATFSGIEETLSRFRWLQHGRVHLYVLYIMVTLLVLLVWKMGLP